MNWGFYEEEQTFLASESEAHAEWHRNSGVPMGTPGCPQDACHLDDDGPPTGPIGLFLDPGVPEWEGHPPTGPFERYVPGTFPDPDDIPF